MKEIEVKVLNIDKNKIELKLKNLGAELVKDEIQYNYIFDTEKRRLKEK